MMDKPDFDKHIERSDEELHGDGHLPEAEMAEKEHSTLEYLRLDVDADPFAPGSYTLREHINGHDWLIASVWHPSIGGKVLAHLFAASPKLLEACRMMRLALMLYGELNDQEREQYGKLVDKALEADCKDTRTYILNVAADAIASAVMVGEDTDERSQSTEYTIKTTEDEIAEFFDGRAPRAWQQKHIEKGYLVKCIRAGQVRRYGPTLFVYHVRDMTGGQRIGREVLEYCARQVHKADIVKKHDLICHVKDIKRIDDQHTFAYSCGHDWTG
jgi:hypothetical protein